MFVLEPMVGRILLPAYGGGFHVWTTCLMFFQGVLLVGYLYAHFVAPRIGRWHLLVACAPLCLLPIQLSAAPDQALPVLSMLAVLAARIAIPFAVLSTTSIVAQSWLARSSDGGSLDPYRLYAASNAGSLLGLLAYPFLFEPWLGLQAQRWAWSAAYLGYLALALLLAPAHERVAPAHAKRPSGAHEEPALAWFVLSTATSMLLMGVTNALSFDIGSIPLVWVAPLALYLASFILVFRESHPETGLWARLWPVAAVAGLVALALPVIPGLPRIAMHLAALFATCMAAHRQLHRLRPPPHALTRYYVVMSLGGWAGAVFVTFAAPVLFDRLHEYAIAIVLVAIALAMLDGRRSLGLPHTERPALRGVLAAPVAVTAFALFGVLSGAAGHESARKLVHRNHYGLYQVGDVRASAGAEGAEQIRQIVHNGTIHGAQVLDGPGRHQPIGYYHRAGGIGDVIELSANLHTRLRVGVVGLGAGTLAAYIRAEDEMVFYEIDPDGEKLARSWFSYLENAAGRVRVVIGDARLTLASDVETTRDGFDVLLVDAFSGDAVPTHLLTREALTLYRSKLRPGGVLVFHITNRLYDLRPILEAQARVLGMHAASKVRDTRQLEPLERRTVYWAMSEEAEPIGRLLAKGWQPIEPFEPSRDGENARSVWTDDYVNTLAPLWMSLTSARR
jgi:SAM-dependent methyltransferase